MIVLSGLYRTVLQHLLNFSPHHTVHLHQAFIA